MDSGAKITKGNQTYYIYTTEEISEEIPNATFRLTYLGEQELNVLDHKKVY